MIVKGSDDEALHLERCLASVAKHVDGIFITITQPNNRVREVATKYNATISDFEWINDFAAARNFNFSQVTPEYTHILWLDADDIMPNAHKLKELCENHGDDYFITEYRYEFNDAGTCIVSQPKTRVIKKENPPIVEWIGNGIHEDFRPLRQLTGKMVTDIEVIHTSRADRKVQSTNRNIEIARDWLKKNPNDPRSYWNLANSLKAKTDDNEVIELYKKFIELTSSEVEKYLAILAMADIYISKGMHIEAMEVTRKAIGLKPECPDGYFQLGRICEILGDLEKAERYLMMSIQLPPRVHEYIVYNPRNYDFNPLLQLGNVYFKLNRPKESLKCFESCKQICPYRDDLDQHIKTIRKAVELSDNVVAEVKKMEKLKRESSILKRIKALPVEMQSHPILATFKNHRFIKKESSGKDLVIYCYPTMENWTPESAMKDGIGGSEEAVINLSREFAKSGWNVQVYNSCGAERKIYDGVEYIPFWEWNYRDKQDVVILWRSPLAAKFEINADKVFVDLHDCLPESEFTPDRLKNIDRIFVKSEAHKELYPNLTLMIDVIPNGIDTKLFNEGIPDNDYGKMRDDKLIINTSSPDRSIDACLAVFEIVKKECPDAKFAWAYGWKGFNAVNNNNQIALDWMMNAQKKMRELGVQEMGRLSHVKIAELYQRANVFLYPTKFYEIDCISARKAQLGGNYCVATDAAALKTTIKFGEKFKVDAAKIDGFGFGVHDQPTIEAMAKAVIKQLKNPMTEQNRQEMIKWALDFKWENIAKQWLKHL